MADKAESGFGITPGAFVFYVVLAALPMVLPVSWTGAAAIAVLGAAMSVPLYRKRREVGIWWAFSGWVASALIGGAVAHFFWLPTVVVDTNCKATAPSSIAEEAKGMLVHHLRGVCSSPPCKRPSVKVLFTAKCSSLERANELREIFKRANWGAVNLVPYPELTKFDAQGTVFVFGDDDKDAALLFEKLRSAASDIIRSPDRSVGNDAWVFWVDQSG